MIVAVFPAVAAAIAFAFAAQMGRQYARRRRAHALAWCLALALFGLASACVAVGVSAGWSTPVFAVYWLAGALLTVPLLAVGQLQLMDPKRATLYWSLGAVAAAVALWFTLTADVEVGALRRASAQRGIPLGRQVLGGTTAYALARPFSLTFVVVVAGSVWSAAKTRRWGILLIAAGVTVVAGSSSAVRVGQGQAFSVLLAVGVAMMYGGFLAASRPPRPAREPVP
ncbi:MAG: hypothetical protein M3276_04475 [Actinomycetota bacterium]|nr:hypothetical protein [Actinomycetota bacterium]